jgi:hypothetical protein
MNLGKAVHRHSRTNKTGEHGNTRGTEERDAFGSTEAEQERPAELEDAMDQQEL